MDNLLSLTLEAHYPERNCHRRYQITVGQDLFGEFTATIHYGRIGQAGHTCRYSSCHSETLKAILRQKLGRRLSAPKRIGCGYKLSDFSVQEGLDKSFCLDEALLDRFGR